MTHAQEIIARLEGKHYRVKELAEKWAVSEEYILQLIEHEPDIVRLSPAPPNGPAPRHKGKKRRAYTITLIPEAVAIRIYQRSMQGGIK